MRFVEKPLQENADTVRLVRLEEVDRPRIEMLLEKLTLKLPHVAVWHERNRANLNPLGREKSEYREFK